MSEEKLTGNQKLFADHYLGDCNRNATRAAIAAGYSEKTAHAIGYENLRKPKIRRYIDEKLSGIVLTAPEVLSELSDIAKAEWRESIEVRRDKDGDVIEATLR